MKTTMTLLFLFFYFFFCPVSSATAAPVLPQGINCIHTDQENQAMREVARRLLSDEFIYAGSVNTPLAQDPQACTAYMTYKMNLSTPTPSGSLSYRTKGDSMEFIIKAGCEDAWTTKTRKQREAEAWINQRTANMPPTFESAMCLYSEIVDQSVYDYSCEDDQSAYGAIINHKGTCNAFARLFDAELQQIGIESYYVMGNVDGMQAGHCWNVFIINGKQYTAEITKAISYRGIRDKAEFCREDYSLVLNDPAYHITQIW